jgi:hypothetical protein
MPRRAGVDEWLAWIVAPADLTSQNDDGIVVVPYGRFETPHGEEVRMNQIA